MAEESGCAARQWNASARLAAVAAAGTSAVADIPAVVAGTALAAVAAVVGTAVGFGRRAVEVADHRRRRVECLVVALDRARQCEPGRRPVSEHAPE